MEELKQNLSQNMIDLTGRNVIVFGSGNTALLNQELLNQELDFKYFCDNNPQKIGTKFLGRDVISFEQLLDFDNPLVITCLGTPQATAVVNRQLDESKIEHYSFNKFILQKYRQRVIEAYELMDTQEDRNKYASIVNSRLKDIKYPIEVFSLPINSYFDNPQVQYYGDMSNYVDIGAYVGDTVERFIDSTCGLFENIYAFEPDSHNYKMLNNRIERLRNEWNIEGSIHLIKKGVDEKTCSKSFKSNSGSANGLSSSYSSGSGDLVENVSLDDYFKNKYVSLIKADIEGYETKMLNGGVHVIKRDEPSLAICVYHTATDIFKIPLLIKQINEDYHFNLSHYSNGYTETVVHAYTIKR